MRFNSDIGPDRTIEGELLVDQQIREFLSEDARIFLCRKVAVFSSPYGDRIDDSPNQLLDALFPLRSTELTAKVFGDHDIGGELGPRFGNFYIVLLKNGLSFFSRDNCAPFLPLYFGIRMHTRAGEITLHGKT